MTEKTLREFDRQVGAEVEQRLESGDWVVVEEPAEPEQEKENPYDDKAHKLTSISTS